MKTKSGQWAQVLSMIIMVTLTLSVLGVTPAYATPPSVRFAKPSASGIGDCLSWDNACTLQTALTGAASGDQIWVAAGTHKPTTGTDRNATFQLKDGVAVYGGFAGTETARDQRNPAANPTILSGDIDNNDSQSPVITNLQTVTSNTANSYTVVTGATGAILDGFIITAGYANEFNNCPNPGCGGGLYNNSSSPTLTNIIFSGNWANWGGGGMVNQNNSNPELTNITFSNNSAEYNGGGLFNREHSNPTLTNVIFSGNSATTGGGINNSDSSPVLTNITFRNNSAYNGGGISNDHSNPTLTNVILNNNSASNGGGGLFNFYSSSMLTNVTFSNNSAPSGGGLENSFGSPILTNVTLTGNSGHFGGGMYNVGGDPQIHNTIFWSNTASSSGNEIYYQSGYFGSLLLNDSVVQDGCPAGSTCTNIITSDPKLGVLGSYDSPTQTIPLLAGSSAIDTGNDGVCPASDQRGVTRPQGAHCDLGAYEYADTVVLATQIDTQPSNPSPVPGASFAFSGSSNTGGAVTFECSLDGAAFAACLSPQSYTGLANGAHTFAVRAKDPLGNLDITPAVYTWVINTHVTVIRYVKPTGTGDCSSWENACRLQTALAGTFRGDEIWVASGLHKPATGTDRNATFYLREGVALYGGFAGTETMRDQRDPTSNLTILSGDIDNNDSQTPIITDLTTVTGNGTNSYHVVTGANGATLDGFTITAGYAIGMTTCPSINCGGGMYNLDSSPILSNLTFSGNKSNDSGGGIYNYGANSHPILTNITFNNNSARFGGGIYIGNDTSPTLTNVTFSNNSANEGGGVYNKSSGATLTNITFFGNSAAYGGGLNTSGNPQIRNTIFWGNTATSDGAQIYHYLYANGSALVSDSIIQGGCPTGNTCTNIYNGDPKLGVLGNHGGFTQTIPILAGSSAINTGNDAVCPSTDQRGVARPQSAHCDIGAYEYDSPIYSSFYHAKPVASGTGDCSSWANACTLQTALTSTTSGDEIWVAAGLHKPTTGTDRYATFQLMGGVAVYGGFAGVETMRDQRNPAANITILSGDIDNNDSQTPIITDIKTVTGNTSNSFQVVIGATGATLDGFTITAGNSIAFGVCPGHRACGGGMLNNGSSPIMANLTFSGNSAVDDGGGMSNFSSNPILTNVTFSSNLTNQNGGGMSNFSSSPTLTNVTFSNNSAGIGGGIYNYNSSPILTNITLSGNSAGWGGGIYNQGSNPQIRNTILWGNTASNGAQIYNSSSTPSVRNSVVQGGYAGGTNIITADPRLRTLGNYGGLTPTFSLRVSSSAIDTGNDPTCATTDQRGVVRPQGAHCDIGAVEALSISGNAGVGGATLRYTDVTAETAIADGGGNYSFTVSYGWTGAIIPSKTRYIFSPPSINISTPVSTNLPNQNFTAKLLSTIADFNGDGKTDVSVFRPSNGIWYVKDQFAQQYGGASDIPVPGDYDGNGTTDVAVFRPSNGIWYLLGGTSVQYGGAGDIPVPGDYDGNGITDVAVFRPSNGVWYIRGGTPVQYGGAGDIPVPGDYDGNGTTDVAVFRPSNGVWYVNGQINQQWGGAGDIPVPGDYNRDGKIDVAVFRPSNGMWYIKDQFAVQYGGAGDIPIPGDYDGNGTTDITVFRPSNGTWYIYGISTVQYGGAGDFPCPARDTNGDGDPYQDLNQ